VGQAYALEAAVSLKNRRALRGSRWFALRMCCFSGNVTVTGTHIFARAGEGNAQLLAYQMDFSAKDPLAMILPLPVATEAKASSVRFINLESYPSFFEDLAEGIHGPTKGETADDLAVVQVGSFEASFVPTRRDFAKLDKRFRLPDKVWDQSPGYANYGFAVFKLRPDAKILAGPARDGHAATT
jgi:hypothetical protein